MGMTETGMPPMMPSGHMVLAGAGLMLLLGLIALILFFRKPLRQVPASLTEITGKRLSGPRFSTVETLPDAAFVVLADISGYTAFMQGSRFAADHAQYLVLSLLDSVVAAAESTLRFLKVEGDAVLFICEAADPGRAGDGIARKITEMAAAFYGTRQSLAGLNKCPCKACVHVDELDIKFVVDFGEIGLFTVDGRADASGTPLIRAHRLLKAERGPGHLLVSETAARYVGAPWHDTLEPRAYELEGLGAVSAHFAPLANNLSQTAWEARTSSSSTAQKLAFNLKKAMAQMRPSQTSLR